MDFEFMVSETVNAEYDDPTPAANRNAMMGQWYCIVLNKSFEDRIQEGKGIILAQVHHFTGSVIRNDKNNEGTRALAATDRFLGGPRFFTTSAGGDDVRLKQECI